MSEPKPALAEQNYPATPDTVAPGIKAASKGSWESRSEAYTGDARPIDEKITTWNNGFLKGIKAFVIDETVDAQVLEERKQALASFGLTFAENEDTHTSLVKVEAFRKRYVSEKEDEAEIGYATMLTDVANGCKNAEGVVDLQKLETRLQAIDPMLKIFGTDKRADQLVAEYALDLGQSEDREKKTLDHAPPATQDETITASAPDPIINHEYERESIDELTAAEVADALINYRTGEVTNEQRLDLKKSYETALSNFQTYVAAHSDAFPVDTTTYVISDVAQAMIDRIASEANRQHKDLPMLLYGKSIPRGDQGSIVFVGLASPAIDYTRQNTHFDYNSDYNQSVANLWKLMDSTNLYDTFSHDVENNAEVIVNARAHTTQPDATTWTDADTTLAQQLVAVDGSAHTGIATLVPGEGLCLNIVASTRDDQGTLHMYDHLPYEYRPTLPKEFDKNLGTWFTGSDGNPYRITRMHEGYIKELTSSSGEVISDEKMYELLKEQDIATTSEILDPAPLDEHTIQLASWYLRYNDVKQAHGEQISLDEDREFFSHPPRKYYAREFAHMIEEYGEEWLYNVAQYNVAKLTQRLDALRFPISEYGQSPSWYLWYAAKERVLAKHDDIQRSLPNAEEYRPYDPLKQYMNDVPPENAHRSQQAEEDIVTTWMGWEIYGYQRTYGNITTTWMNAQHQERLHTLLSEAPSAGRNTLSAYKLREIGEIFTKYIPLAYRYNT